MDLDGLGEPPGSDDAVLAAQASKMLAELGRGAIQHMVDEIQQAIVFGDEAAVEERGRLLRAIERQFFAR